MPSKAQRTYGTKTHFTLNKGGRRGGEGREQEEEEEEEGEEKEERKRKKKKTDEKQTTDRTWCLFLSHAKQQSSTCFHGTTTRLDCVLAPQPHAVQPSQHAVYTNAHARRGAHEPRIQRKSIHLAADTSRNRRL